MSVWDFTGAVLWSFMAWAAWGASRVYQHDRSKTAGDRSLAFIMAVVLTAAAVYCIGRIFGAHL